MFGTYADHDLDTDPVLFLPCGHFFSMSTLDGVIGIDRAYDRINSDSDFRSLRSMIGSDVSEKAVQCPDCRGAIHSVRRYARITKFAGLRSLERKHMMGVERALGEVSKKSPSKRKLKVLLEVKKKIMSSPMRVVFDACGGRNVEAPLPPAKPLMRCLQLLGEAHAENAMELDDESYKKAIQSFEEAIEVATNSKSMHSEASLRIAFVRFMMNWVDKEPSLKAKCHEHLEPIFQLENGFADNLVEEAKRLKNGLSGADIKMVLKAMSHIDGYDYGGTASSHWYECPNGHPYYIGECGGAMQTSRCLECGEVVGGSSHQLESSNRQWTGYGRYTT